MIIKCHKKSKNKREYMNLLILAIKTTSKRYMNYEKQVKYTKIQKTTANLIWRTTIKK